jgi:hypothetical protein
MIIFSKNVYRSMVLVVPAPHIGLVPNRRLLRRASLQTAKLNGSFREVITNLLSLKSCLLKHRASFQNWLHLKPKEGCACEFATDLKCTTCYRSERLVGLSFYRVATDGNDGGSRDEDGRDEVAYVALYLDSVIAENAKCASEL